MTNSHPALAGLPSGADYPADPYLHLEQLSDPAVDAWAAAQTGRTMAAFGHTAHADRLTARMLDAMLAPDRMVVCERYDDWAYNIWNDADNPLGLVRRMPWDAWVDGQQQWEIILSVDALDLNNQDGDATRWALAGFELTYPTHDRALVYFAPGGGDAFIVREFDIATRSFVENGFELPQVGLHAIDWIDRDSVYVNWDDSSINPAAALTDGGSPRQVRKWQRATPLTDAPVVFACEATDVGASAYYEPINRRHGAARSKSYMEAVHYWLDQTTGAWQAFDLPLDARLTEWNEWLLIEPRADWIVAEATYRAGSLLAIRRAAFLGGSRRCAVLFTPACNEVLSTIQCTKHWMVVAHKSDSITRVTLWLPPATDDDWKATSYPLPHGSEASVTTIDPTRDDLVLIHVMHFLMPPALYIADLASDVPWRLLTQLSAHFDATGLMAQRRHAIAPDGVAIPYWIIGREADLLHRRPQPCVLEGYGGFEVDMDTPAYLASEGMAWLEQGGVHVIASIRGGGEFGPAWHSAALRDKRQVAFSDFIAVAEALISDGVTTSAQLAITGGSNGGLLTAVCMLQRPELFGAVISDMPLLDMARFHVLLQGANWIDEYGDPGHARKMVAKMQALGHDNVWYLEHADGGHGAGVEPESIARAHATSCEFLRQKIGAKSAGMA